MSLTLDRIKSQLQVHYTPAPIVVPKTVVHHLDDPISLDELRELLLNALLDTVEQPVVMSVVQDEVRFPNIFTFVEWYEKNKDHFTDAQRQALDTLVNTRQMIEAGCACKRAGREYAAHQYYNTFWTNNAKTDMMPALLKALNAKKVFLSDCVIYPLPVA